MEIPMPTRAIGSWKLEVNKTQFLCIGLFALLIRLAVALHPYSGAQTPPTFGDYEAQRHWMEITINLPVREWYRNSTANDMGYWGLDYPPLTAYQSYIHGLMLKFFDPASVSLFTSRGYESYLGKLLMRWTVVLSDLLIFFPAVFLFVFLYHSLIHNGEERCISWHTAMVLLNPCLILIDHGHFQYNCISLGLTAAAVAAILSDRDLSGSMLFCLALNHKQMSAYYAPAFFAYLFGKCLKRQNPIFEVLKLGLVVLGIFAVVWWPYLYSMDASLEVLSRLAPFERGIYEDYVANFWCSTSVIVKWKRLFSTQTLKFLSLATTAFACLPSMIQLVRSPTKPGFLYGLLNSSLAFYSFSFQVHEKSILLPLLPASFLAMEQPSIYQWLIYNALLSMFPLLNRDKLVLPYAALSVLFALFYHAPYGKEEKTGEAGYSLKSVVMKYLMLCCSVLLHVIYLSFDPPERYPFVEAFIVTFCFPQFVFIALYLNFKQWSLSSRSCTCAGARVDFEKKRV